MSEMKDSRETTLVEVQRKINEAISGIYAHMEERAILMDRIVSMSRRISELEMALFPFADVSSALDEDDDDKDDVWKNTITLSLMVGDFRRAARVMKGEPR